MAPLIPEVQQMIVTFAVASMVPILAIPISALLMRQLRWFGYSWGDDD